MKSLPPVIIRSGAETASAGGAQAPGAAPQAPFLDMGAGNVPEVSGKETRKPWTRQQWFIWRSVLDCIRYWQGHGYQLLWVTLTSAPQSSRQELRVHFQTLRKRIARQLGFKCIEYCCVDTREGHGVLHMIWAWRDQDPNRRASFYVPFEWLQVQWKEIHGAFHVNLKRMGGADGDARKLSRYVVSQYCGKQSGLVRLSRSRMEVPLARMRQALYSELRRCSERYYAASELPASLPLDEFSKRMSGMFWSTFRTAWDDLVRSGRCKAFGVLFLWFRNELQRV